MIAVDVTPLVLGSRRGVARAQAELLGGLARIPRPAPVALFAPGPLPRDVPTLDRVVVEPAATPRRFRRRLPALLAHEGARVLLSPWSAFPSTDVPVVVTVHELPFLRDPAWEGRGRAWRHRRWLRRDRLAAASIVPSRSTRDDLLALGEVAPERVHVVPHAFDADGWRAKAAPASGGGPDVLAVGTGHGDGRKKGMDVLARALAAWQGPRPEVAVVGAPPRALLRQGVRVHGDPSDAELAALLASARVLVHPARSEGFGYPPLEAMALGLPVVTTDGGALPEVVGDAALVVPCGDAPALRDALARVLEDEALRTSLARRGRERARAFPPEVTARRTLDVLEGLLR